ncbi:MAG: hypothetical protein E7324_04880 [Clostridiales bacterium]|nr:hypothetical protein [Clostridiales bacterium]
MKKLSSYAHEILNDPVRIAERDQWFLRMENVFDSRPDEENQRYVFTLSGDAPRPADWQRSYTHPEEWTVECLEMMAALPPNPAHRFAPVCLEFEPYGVHFIDKLFGARVYNYQGQWNADYLETPVGTLEMPDLDKSEDWALARRVAETFLAADVALPLIGTPGLSSALNIFVNLYGGEGLAVMLEDEEAAMHDLQMINDLIRTLRRWYIDHIPVAQMQPVISYERTQPPRSGQLCGCSCQLLSPDLYRDMIAPLDDAVLSDYSRGGLIHLCGSHTQHIPTFREMKHLRALQLNDRAAEDLALYLEGLREDQIVYVNPCKGMPVEKAVEISKGKRIILCARMDAPVIPGV